jgi:hypothetical protein
VHAVRAARLDARAQLEPLQHLASEVRHPGSLSKPLRDSGAPTLVRRAPQLAVLPPALSSVTAVTCWTLERAWRTSIGGQSRRASARSGASVKAAAATLWSQPTTGPAIAPRLSQLAIKVPGPSAAGERVPARGTLVLVERWATIPCELCRQNAEAGRAASTVMEEHLHGARRAL